jgi:hypothetical protein
MARSLTSTLEKSLRPGWHLYWQQQTYQILSLHLDNLLVRVVNIATNETEDLSLDALLTNHQDDTPLLAAPSLTELHQEIVHHQPQAKQVDATTLPTPLLARADNIIAAVEAVESMVAQMQRRALLQGETPQRTQILQLAIKQLDTPIALPTFYKYRHMYDQSHGDRLQLAASLRRSTFNQNKVSKASSHFLDTLILRYYARKHPIRPETLYRLAQSVMKRTGHRWLDPVRCGATIPQDIVEELLDAKLPMMAILDNAEKRSLLVKIDLPSRSWFYGYLRWFENQPDQGQYVITERYGREVWEHEHLVFDTYVTRATFPLQYVFADHCLLDVFIVDEATRSQLNRLWLTLLIDAYSRSILGLALLYETPGIMAIQSALQHAIWPKTSHRKHGIQQEWVCFGIPQQLSLDNAWGHHSHSLENLARVINQNGRYHSMDLLFRPPYRGRYGALVERFFGNLGGQIKEHLLGAFPPSHKKQIRSAAREACLLYQDIDWFIHRAIVNYQHTVHSELDGLTPHEKWVTGSQCSIPLVPSATAEMQRLFWHMSPSTRVITSKGISAFGMHYWSPDLGRAERVGKNGQRIQFSFRYDPADIGCLALFRDGAWVGDVYAKQLREPDGSVRSISLAERHLAQKMAQNAGQSPQDWLRYIQDIDERNRTRYRERQAASRQSRANSQTQPLAPGKAKDTEDALANLSTTASYQEYTDLLAAFLGNDSNEKP